MIRIASEALVGFAVTAAILYVGYFLTTVNTHRASAVAVLPLKGYTLILMGVLYIVFGFIVTKLK
jgi:hypothetical protein